MVDITELDTAVGNIQADILDSTEGVEYFDINVITNGWCMIVEFLNIQLWSSEEDDREFDEVLNEHESIEGFLRKAIRGELDKMKKIVV
tara:strand:+ start:2022 stop:2288 length:267 start_codon:yes stop_codon:yes gene_type:complete